jgi:hypothetical protein
MHQGVGQGGSPGVRSGAPGLDQEGRAVVTFHAPMD